jgi:glycosyltransferase involved in cell wall biosynthesis
MDICVAPEPSDPYNERSTAAKVMEYMAAAKPIVAFDIPEHRFSAQGSALYANPNDDLDLARKIECLIHDPQQRERLGKLGRVRIEKELAWEFQAAFLVEAYRKIFSENNKSRGYQSNASNLNETS